MCTVSMIGDHYRDRWYPTTPTAPTPVQTFIYSGEVSREEFDALKREVEEMKQLLIRAKKYDEDNGEPDCEMDEKVALLRRVADLVGVDLTDVLGES